VALVVAARLVVAALVHGAAMSPRAQRGVFSAPHCQLPRSARNDTKSSWQFRIVVAVIAHRDAMCGNLQSKICNRKWYDMGWRWPAAGHQMLGMTCCVVMHCRDENSTGVLR